MKIGLKLEDILSYIFEKKICIYTCVGDSYETTEYTDLYYGAPEEVPLELKKKTLKSIGAKKKGILDIEVLL